MWHFYFVEIATEEVRYIRCITGEHNAGFEAKVSVRHIHNYLLIPESQQVMLLRCEHAHFRERVQFDRHFRTLERQQST
jgi:hypothetical protein